jgi:hypothetical protein
LRRNGFQGEMVIHRCLDGTAAMTRQPPKAYVLWVCAYDMFSCLSRHAIPRCTMHYVVLLFTLSLVTIFATRLVLSGFPEEAVKNRNAGVE